MGENLTKWKINKFCSYAHCDICMLMNLFIYLQPIKLYLKSVFYSYE